METTNQIFSIKNGEIHQKDKMILKDVNIHLDKGEFVYLIGRTGTGKSSLLKTLYGELPLQKGSGQVAGFDLTTMKRKDIPFLRRNLGIVFQDFQLLSDRSIMDNLIFVMKSTGWKKKDEIQKRAMEVLSLVGLDHIENKMPHQVSGGEQQRVSIARALVNKPAFILADEPTGNLDPETSKEIVAVLMAIAKEGTSVLMATHDLALMEQFPSRTMQVKDHTVIELNPMNAFNPFEQVKYE
ncbi:ATP-binding cassette domain-containing protein [Paracrocinitomix mangrovi]|uniref:cell division ATP-binding protein FtsE n=1 Tax=Paracrocinitomix mangrovi TaxID=2862509 RepID=UPI001C8EC7E3|nr:ATP-binding cassette domain-containing protein [Paracrocinitomix mangrovi]UKN00997.1 ATP-binding cassette domain-containing protein [Paracrocinitomix mangrovi]